MSRVLGTFSGIGGFELAFQRAGADIVGMSEIDVNANAVLRTRFPDVPNLGNIKEIYSGDLPEFDILTGGFPCQDVSVAGRRAGLAGERSGLFFELLRLLAGRRPRWFVFENVPGLLSSNSGADFARVLYEVGQLGYGVAWRVLDAQFFGVPQRRRRVFVVGCLGHATRAGAVLFERAGGCWNPPARDTAGKAVAALTASGVGTCGADDNQAQAGHLIPVGHFQHGYGQWTDADVSGPLMARDHKGNPGQVALAVDCYRKARRAQNAEDFETWEPSDVTNTLNVSDNTGDVRATQLIVEVRGVPYEIDPSTLRVRRLTPLECERLQGLPDDWTDVAVRTLKNGKVKRTSDSARYAATGNAVAVPVVEWIARRLLAVDAR